VPGKRYAAPRRAELSQHFLRSASLAAELVARSSIVPSDLVVEIGPGRGVLTRALARASGHVRAIELDARLARELREAVDAPNVEVVRGDFLRTPLPDEPYRVLANIPFARTADIVRRLTDGKRPPEDAYLIVQREAAERYAGGPYADESVTSLSLKPWWHAEIVRRLRRTDFDPPPRVDPVMLWLGRRARPLVADVETRRYRSFVDGAFGRGRSVRSALRRELTAEQIRRLARDLRFELKAPPSALSFDQWLGLFRFASLAGRGAPPAAR
jgi:23S rRNA (adenine-N6)-dimethyltransferase